MLNIKGGKSYKKEDNRDKTKETLNFKSELLKNHLHSYIKGLKTLISIMLLSSVILNLVSPVKISNASPEDDNEVIQKELDPQEKQLSQQSCTRDMLTFDATNNRLDLFENNNLDKALLGVIDAIMSTNEADPARYNHLKGILNNSTLMNTFVNIKDCLMSDKLDAQTKRIHIVAYLVAAEAAMTNSNLSGNQFLGFITSAKNAYEVIVSRELANQIIEENRVEVEKQMESESTSAEITLNFNATSGALEPKLSFGVNIGEGGSEKNFYRINRSGNFGGSITFGLPKNADLSLNSKLELAQVLVCRSLEQFLDSNSKFSATIYKRAPKINDIAKARRQMQEHERAVLSNFKASMEFYLKFLQVIPQNVQLTSPKITRTSSANKEFNIQATTMLSADLKALAKAGISAKAGGTGGYTATQVYHNYLSLITEDCLPSSIGGSVEKIIHKLKTADFPIVCGCSSNISGKNDGQAIVILASNVKGDLIAYNQCLSIISNDQSTKRQKADAKSVKHTMEKRWLSQKHTGRLNMLKAAVSVVSMLRSAYDFNKKAESLKLFNDLYFQILELEKFQTLTSSMIASKRAAEFSTTHKSQSYGIEGSFDFEIPIIGKSTARILYDTTSSEFKDGNNKKLTFIVKLPVHNDNIIGQKAFQKTLDEVQKRLAQSSNDTVKIINKGVELLIEKFVPILKDLNYKTKEPIYKKIAKKIPKKYAQLTIEFAQTPSNSDFSLPLPGEETVCKRNQVWALKRVIATEIKTLKAEDLSVGLASANIAGELKKNSTAIGDDSLMFLANKFNNFAQRLQDRTSQEKISELWTSFKIRQEDQLKRLFSNINNSESNARYELQCMYNEIKLNNLNDYYVDETFLNFLKACEDFSNDVSEVNASNLLDDVLQLNFDYGYILSFNRLHVLKYC